MVLKILFFIKINATWIILLLPFVARYFGVICFLREPLAEKKLIAERAEVDYCEVNSTGKK